MEIQVKKSMILLFLISCSHEDQDRNVPQNYQIISTYSSSNPSGDHSCDDCPARDISLCEFMFGAQNVVLVELENPQDIGYYNKIDYHLCPEAQLYDDIFPVKTYAITKFKTLDSIISRIDSNVLMYAPQTPIFENDSNFYYLASLRTIEEKTFVLDLVRVSLDHIPSEDSTPGGWKKIKDLPETKEQLHETIHEYYNHFLLYCPDYDTEHFQQILQSYDNYANYFNETCFLRTTHYPEPKPED
jgi:hypothetical protein